MFSEANDMGKMSEIILVYSRFFYSSNTYNAYWLLIQSVIFLLRIKEPKSYPCAECDKVFAAQSSLRYHRETVHTKVMHKCNVEGCGMVSAFFREKGQQKEHLKPFFNERYEG